MLKYLRRFIKEGMMAVKVIIERTVSADNQEEVSELLKELRSRAVRQPGYISGETLFSMDRPGTYVVISTWESVNHWKAWKNDALRQEVISKIDPLLLSEREIGVFADSPLSWVRTSRPSG